jgi:integrase-like protein
LIRFQADLQNEMWQADITHWRLANGADVEILNMIDDHSRLFLASQAFSTVKAADVVDVLYKTGGLHELPASLLTDNGAVFTDFHRGGKVLLKSELERLGVIFTNSRPTTPDLRQDRAPTPDPEALPGTPARPPRTIRALQKQLEAFAHHYNDICRTEPWTAARRYWPTTLESRPPATQLSPPTLPGALRPG